MLPQDGGENGVGLRLVEISAFHTEGRPALGRDQELGRSFRLVQLLGHHLGDLTQLIGAGADLHPESIRDEYFALSQLTGGPQGITPVPAVQRPATDHIKAARG